MEDNLEPLQTSDNNRIVPVNIEEQMKTAYIDYSMSVIVGRALPDVRPNATNREQSSAANGRSDDGLTKESPRPSSKALTSPWAGHHDSAPLGGGPGLDSRAARSRNSN